MSLLTEQEQLDLLREVSLVPDQRAGGGFQAKCPFCRAESIIGNSTIEHIPACWREKAIRILTGKDKNA